MRSQSRPARPARLARAAVVGCTALTLAVTSAGTAGAAPGDPARQVLPHNDGWAAADGGTTGGAAADRAHVYTVDTWAELKAAVGNGDGTPRIIRVVGTLDANSDASGRPLSCADYATDGYSLEGYLAAYDPATWGKADPSGPQEEARLASAARQASQIRLNVGSNTTLVGVGDHARLLGANVQVRGVDNVIVRNLTFEDTFDCFPQWDPTDGAEGAWNSEYDSLVVYGSTHVWADHNTFTDGRRPDAAQPRYYGREFQQHDGQLDVVRGADLVTVSWNVFADHSKTILIGNSDSATATDRGRLRVTLHHNLFRDTGERTPRVRFGQVDVYDNHHLVKDPASFGYAYGVGKESAIHAEKNHFTLPASVPAGDVLHKWSEAPITAEDNFVNGAEVDLIARYNAEHPDAVLRRDAGWSPELRARVDETGDVPGFVARWAGAGQLDECEPHEL
ncbi:pectate lyase family protein [Streptomyces fragilis]|uniref:Pectate lyase n=1 Tax=Streptomyces fragilis TaxID=67301 RepID=A0ABV2YMG3_9ACTN|nr:pectate lyase [Streptomyces fragilis]